MSALPVRATFDEEALDLLRRLTAAVETLVVVTQGRPKATEQDAIAALLVVGPHMTEISRKTGLNRTSLYRMRRFMACYRQAQGPKREPRRGYRITGGIEAVSPTYHKDHDDD